MIIGFICLLHAYTELVSELANTLNLPLEYVSIFSYSTDNLLFDVVIGKWLTKNIKL